MHLGGEWGQGGQWGPQLKLYFWQTCALSRICIFDVSRRQLLPGHTETCQLLILKRKKVGGNQDDDFFCNNFGENLVYGHNFATC